MCTLIQLGSSVMRYGIFVFYLASAIVGLLLFSGDGITAPCPPEAPGASGGSGAAASADPNALTGPMGYGDKNYIPSGSVLPYRIDFENDSAATAPAQQVDITNDLNQKLDWSTFEITEVGFGDRFISVPPGSKKFETTVSMTHQNVTFDVQIKAGIDVTTGEVYAHFYSIDPETGLPPSVEAGFLPPEDGSSRGMGHVSYIINHDPELAENTEIRNIALIVFDMGEHIYTNQVDPHDPGKGTDPVKEALVTIDKNRPTSSVAPLPKDAASTTFTVNWTGSDTASGIAGYNIYSRDGLETAWHLWQEKTTATSADFAGIPGHTHEFYSVAIDNVGLIEEKVPVPDTKTYINPEIAVDSDNDGVTDSGDNCPAIANADQADQDGDGKGDACDPCRLDADNDIDGDGVCGNADNCPTIINPEQADFDHDGIGDLCDADDDNDGIDDPDDNCPLVTNSDQADLDGDGKGDLCDEDDDGDTIADTDDNCPLVSNPDQADLDGDGQGNLCDEDDDNDDVRDQEDNCPLTVNSDQADADSDGQGDICDEDDDNDTIVDTIDDCPVNANSDQADSDGDGPGDACDEDDDNDGIVDTEDNCLLLANPDQADLDGDRIGDICDEDDDNDGIADTGDNCPEIANADQDDLDGDRQGDACDSCPLDADNDLDADSVCGDVDNCPALVNPDQEDLDQDDLGDLCDPQTCGNGIQETSELCDDGNVTNSDGCSDQCISEVTINLSKAEVDWKDGVVRYQGHIELPQAVYPTSVAPQGEIAITIASLDPVVEQINFSDKDNNGMRWVFAGKGESVKKFTIDWQSASFDYRGILHVKANHVERTSTTITFNREGLTGEFTLHLGDASILVGADNSIGTIPASLEVDVDTDGEIEVELPFTLSADTRMVISRPGQPDAEVAVGDYLTAADGKFELQAKFVPNKLTGLDLPAILQLRVTLGQFAYPGYADIDSGWKFINAKEWKYE